MPIPRDINRAFLCALNINPRDSQDIAEIRIRLLPNKLPQVLVVRHLVDVQAQELNVVRERFRLAPIDTAKPEA